MTNLSIEQFELIRRLRNSGIEKDELLMAFDQFDEIDKTFGDIYAIPVSKLQRTNNRPPVNNRNPTNVNKFQRRRPPVQYNSNVTAVNQKIKSESFNGTEEECPPPPPHINNTSTKPHPSNSNQGNLSAVSDVILPHLSRNGLTISPVSTPNTSSSSSSTTSSANDITTWQSANISKMKHNDESKSEGNILDEIRHFIVRHNVKLSMIADMANVIPSAVRNYIHGNLSSVSDETKQKIYMWYHMSKNNPSSLDASVRRERFMFRNSHLQLLEESFKLDSYPDAMKRDYIAEECNRTCEQELGMQINDNRDKVTASIVANWFMTRRKEAKRQLKRVPQNTSGLIENNQMVKLSDGLQYEGMPSPPRMETQDIKPNISEIIQTSSINTPPSYTSAEDNESFISQENEAFIPIQSIKQEPPDIN